MLDAADANEHVPLGLRDAHAIAEEAAMLLATISVSNAAASAAVGIHLPGLQEGLPSAGRPLAETE